MARTASASTAADFWLIDHGSVLILRARTDRAAEWVEAHLPEDAQTWAGGTVIEPRYIADIVDGITADALTVFEM